MRWCVVLSNSSDLFFFLCLSLLNPLLLSRTPRRSRCRFSVMCSAVPPLPHLLQMLPLFVGGVQRIGRWRLVGCICHGFVWLAVLAWPDLLADLVNGAQVGVIDQLHEVSVPQLLIGGLWLALGGVVSLALGGAVSLALGGAVSSAMGGAWNGDDLQRDAEQRLGESMLHRVTLVYTAISAQYSPQQQATICLKHAIIKTDLRIILIMWKIIRLKKPSLSSFLIDTVYHT